MTDKLISEGSEWSFELIERYDTVTRTIYATSDKAFATKLKRLLRASHVD